MRRLSGMLLIVLLINVKVHAERNIFQGNIKDITLKIDTLAYSYLKNSMNYQGHACLPFFFHAEDVVCELAIYPASDTKISHLELLKSSDFVQLDTLVLLDHEYYRTKIKFVNLFKSQFLNFTFLAKLEGSDKQYTEEIRLLPYTKTSVQFFPPTDELYIGEEKVFELETGNLNNIRISGDWVTNQDINYKISENNGHLRLHLLPNALGPHTVNINLQTIVPFITERKEVNFDLPVISQSFKIKSSRLAYLNIDKKNITYDEDARKNGTEIQIDNHRQLIMGKTYRIENQEQPGGALIAELFTKLNMANDRVLCIFRPYNLHRQTEGYLYIKDGDIARFVTNLSVTPKTSVNTISIMHGGQDWSQNLAVNPGETIDVKVEGEALDKARFHWADIVDITSDTMVRSENVVYFRLKIPLAINKKRIELLNNVSSTGYGIAVREYQVPKTFDYINLSYGNGVRTLSLLNPVVIQRSTMKDIIIGFDNLKIDNENKLYGKQYLDIDVRLLNKQGELVEFKSIKGLLVCPGENSPRAAYYNDKSCTNSGISLNTVLGNKTYNMEDFSKVQLEFKNQPDKYSDPVVTRQVDIVLQRAVSFDIDVSFPAGLMIQNLGKTQNERDALTQYEVNLSNYNQAHQAYVDKIINWNPADGTPLPVLSETPPVKPKKVAFTDNLGGISLALIMQVKFPDAEKVGQIKPYRLGVGFLAINTFNFSSDANRDLAAVVIGSVYPIKPGKVFSMPIHFGFGYKFQDQIPFIMLSPGIGIHF